MSLRFLGEDVVSRRVRQRRFDVDCDGRIVPGNLWTPTDDGDDNGDGDGGRSPRPLVLIGHGAGTSKSEPYVVSLARRFVRHHGYAAAAVDGPLHGDRRDDGGGFAISFVEFGQAWANEPDLIDESVAEWTAALDALAALPDVGAGPVGYWGLSMGTILGLPLVAAEPRIKAAVLGLMGIAGPTKQRHASDAAKVTIPVLFLAQWDDELFARDAAFALFDALGTSNKRLHAGPGGHSALSREEYDDTERFLAHHLGPAA
jgi:dienelactone hydrolase